MLKEFCNGLRSEWAKGVLNMYDENKNEESNNEPMNGGENTNSSSTGTDGSMENHQYRYGRSYYQNQQDSIYHTNRAEYQGNQATPNSGPPNMSSNNNQEIQNHSQININQSNVTQNPGPMNTNPNLANQNQTTMNRNPIQAGYQGASYQTYTTGQFENPNQKQKPPKKQKSGGKHVFGKVLKAAACVVLVVAVGAGSAFGTTIWLSKSGRLNTESSSSITGGKKTNTIPVSTVSSSTAVVTDVSNVVQNAMPSVVKITNVGTQTYSGFFGGTYDYESNGSGIIIGQTEDELLIATNQHVVSGANTLQVIFIDEESCEANVKGSDAEKDLAVIAVPIDSIKEETLKEIRVATLGDSNAVKVGEPAIAIGNALGYGQSVTLGVISAKDREVTTENYTNKLIQTDAAINPGNSGGALLNVAGEVIGINSVKYSSTEVEGMGYAIPISDATPIINDLMNKETKTKVDDKEKSYIGISGVDITSDVAQAYNMPKGVYVAQVTKNGPAEKAGIKKGDIITKIADVSVTSYDELKSELEYHAAGTTIKVELLSQAKNSYGYETKTIDVTLARKGE